MPKNNALNSKSKSILILNDMDGVYADWEGYMLKHHLTQFDSINAVNQHPDREELKLAAYIADNELYYNLPIIDGSLEFMKSLKGLETYLDIGWCTARPYNHPNPELVGVHKRMWIRDYVDEPLEMTTLHNFHLTASSGDKAKFIAELTKFTNYDKIILIDDFMRNINDVKEQCDLSRVIPIHFTGSNFGDILLEIELLVDDVIRNESH